VCEHGEFGGKQVVRLGNRDSDLEHVASRRNWLGYDVVLREPFVHGIERLVCRLDELGNLSVNETSDLIAALQTNTSRTSSAVKY
jgi:hypothetical protein